MNTTALTRTLLVAILASGCGGPRLPEELRFHSLTLKKAATWKVEGVQSVVFIPLDEGLRDASIQVGVLTSTEHKTARELNVWLMKQYRLAKVVRWHESVEFDRACKVGQTSVPPRQFVAVHMCQDGRGLSVCVEADARLTSEIQDPDGDGGDDWNEVCVAQWEAHREALKTLADRVLAQR